MMDLKLWLRGQGLSVRELATQLEAPRKTVEDWVYRGVVPSPVNLARLTDFVNCAHHWVIASANGPLSKGICQRCGETRDFRNSSEATTPWLYRQYQPKAS
jgi:hypothetical protein